MKSDLNKGITDIQYNSLNLPKQMVINSSSVKAKNYYTYSASGVKLKTEQRYDPTLQLSPVQTTTPANDGFVDYKNTDYVGNIIYETEKKGAAVTNKTRILVDGGYIENNTYHYYLTDHLGNNRVVANASGTVIQKNHYYPFGTAFADKYDNGTNQPYKYNGKELDQMHGLNWYDYSARHKDDWRFTSVDPLAEKYYSWSPYAYVGNNPLKYIDPTGMDWYEDENGNVMWQEGSDKTVTKTYEGENGSITVNYRNVGTSYTINVDDNVSIRYEQNSIDNVLYLDEDLKNINPQLSASTREPSAMEKWSNDPLFYPIANDLYVTGQGLVHLFSLGIVGRNRVNELTGEKEYANLDGTTNYKAELNAANTAAMAFTSGGSKLGVLAKGLGYVNKLNAAQFSHTFKSTLSTFSPATRGILNKGINQGINTYNNQISNGMILVKAKGLAPKKK